MTRLSLSSSMSSRMASRRAAPNRTKAQEHQYMVRHGMLATASATASHVLTKTEKALKRHALC